MANYDIIDIINKITEKTDSGEIIWVPYDLYHDTNPYSSRYFSTIKDLYNSVGYCAKFQSGYLFLIPEYSGAVYLFLQANSVSLPVALNYGSTSPAHAALLQELYDKIKNSFSSLDDFLNQLMN